MSDSLNPPPDQNAVGWRDRLFGWRAVAATTLASVILGSAGGAALAAAADGTNERGGFPGRGQFPGTGQVPGGFPSALPGQSGTQSQAPAGQAPAGQAPARQAPAGQAPARQGQLPPGPAADQTATLPRTDEKEA